MIRRREISCAELLEHHLARTAAFNPVINAIVTTDIPRAMERALAADRALARGEDVGPLHGLPMTVKEAFDVRGLPTTWGRTELRGHIADHNALAVDRVLDAGANLFGKTNVPVGLADSQSFNPIHGFSNNPWDVTRTTGGSSGGGAAAVAAGLSALEVGSDIASSIRNPPVYCGIYGHRPTFGITPTRGHTIRGHIAPDDMNVLGPMARSADDLEIALGVVAGPDEIDSAGFTLQLPPPRKEHLPGFKVAVMMNDPSAPVDSEMQDSIQRLADFLAREGAEVDDRARPAIDMHRVPRLFATMLRAAVSHRQSDDEYGSSVAGAADLDPSDDTVTAYGLRGQAIRHRDWLKLNDERTKMRRAWHEFFQDYDVLLCPIVPTAAHPHNTTPVAERTVDIDGKQIASSRSQFWAGLIGLSYLPATAIPTGFSKAGLPLGIQVAGPQYGDRTTIHLARLLEAEYHGFVPPPGFG